jgi:D-alanyl-D-alanine carboxypeptidase
MKTMKCLIYVIAALIIITGCTKEDIATRTINCETDYEGHPKNLIYQSVVDKAFQKGLPGVSVAIHTPEEGLWEGSAGYASIEKSIPMTPCHIHYAASIPKAFTGIAILQMEEEGKLSINDPVSIYLDEKIRGYIPNCDKVTIRHLLNHTSGIPDQVGVDFLTDFLNNPLHYFSIDEQLAYLDGIEPLYEPGEDFFYSDANFTILALVIDKVTGDHLRTFSENLFIPSGMQNTTYSYNINHNTVKNLVEAYMDTYSDGHLENVTEWEYMVTSYFKGSGGMATNASDLVLFVRAVFDGTLVSESTLDLIKSDTVHNPLANDWMNDSYGLGFMVIHDEHGTWYGHAGRDPGAANYVFYNLEHGVSIAVMSNIGTFFSLHYTKIIYNDLWKYLCDAIFEPEK